MQAGNIQSSKQILQLLGVNNRALSNNLAALASGNRLTSAATDVAALSIATALQSQNSALRVASSNIAQAESFLQVADGGMAQQQSIIDRMTALAAQANSGALSKAGRAGINTEFQQLRSELDRLSGNTNFNGVNLLDGSLAQSGALTTNTDVAAKASGDLVFTGIAAGNTIQINGQTVTAGVDFTVGASVQQSVTNLTNFLNNSANPAFADVRFTASNGSLNITAKNGGELGNQFFVNRGTSTATFTAQNMQALGSGNVFSLSGGSNAGIATGDVRASGSSLDNIIADANGQAASVSANFNTAGDIQAGNTLRIDDGEGGFVTFTLSANAAASTDIQIGSTLEETLQNAANTINNYTGANDYGVRQLTASVEGNSLKLTANQLGNPTDIAGAALNVQLTTTGGSLSSTIFNNGAAASVNVQNVTNKDFIGTISGFQATRTGADAVQLSLKVGDETYTATVADTTPAGNTTLRFTSANGGSFDLTLQGGKGSAVATQADADAFAGRLDTAFSGVRFNQTRDVEVQPSGTLFGARLSATGANLSSLNINAVKVEGGAGGVTNLNFTVNGATYRSGNIGRELGAGERVTLTNTLNPNETITFTNGNTAFDVSGTAGTKSLEVALKDALGVSGQNGASFQIGATSADVVNLRIGSTGSDALLNGKFDLLSAGNASKALDALRVAGDRLTSERANVGSYQQSLGFTASNVASTLLNQESARATLQDTDIALAALENALATTRNQSGIATLVQSNRLQGNILGLLR